MNRTSVDLLCTRGEKETNFCSSIRKQSATSSHLILHRPAVPVTNTMPIKTDATPQLDVEIAAGRGGREHRYLQQLIKGLAEQRGFRAVIEEGIPCGQVDVALHRDETRIAWEVSVTSTATYESRNISKCLAAGFSHVFVVALNERKVQAIRRTCEANLSAGENKLVTCLLSERIVDALDSLVDPTSSEPRVRGYKVKVRRRAIDPKNAADRRDMVGKLVAKSIREQRERRD
jgi:hypothetical protein